MKNLITGWFTTLLGVFIMVMVFLIYFDIFRVLDRTYTDTEAISAFIIGYVLTNMPPSWIEEQIKKYIEKKNK